MVHYTSTNISKSLPNFNLSTYPKTFFMTVQNTYQVNEISVSYKPTFFTEKITKIITSKDAHEAIKPFFNQNTIGLQEQFIVLYLNRSNGIIGIYPMSTGGITGTVADVRLILSVAIKAAASSIILSHNHPSGNLKPSGQDIDLTIKIKQAASFMDIDVADHIILGNKGQYLSFIDEGLL